MKTNTPSAPYNPPVLPKASNLAGGGFYNFCVLSAVGWTKLLLVNDNFTNFRILISDTHFRIRWQEFFRSV